MTSNLEIERKFLVSNRQWGTPLRSTQIRQGYLMSEPGRALRIRQKGDRYILTLKAEHGEISRYEFEYDVPALDGAQMLDTLCTRAPVEKIRHEVQVGDHLWEVDVFSGANDGLLLAEIELKNAKESFERPAWLGPEVSHDKRFANAQLYQHPFGEWGVSFDTLLADYS